MQVIKPTGVRTVNLMQVGFCVSKSKMTWQVSGFAALKSHTKDKRIKDLVKDHSDGS